jgi:uncharacterized protein YpmB
MDGNCYTNITNIHAPRLSNPAVKCSKNFLADIYDSSYPVTYNKIYSANEITSYQELTTVDKIYLVAGETARYWINAKVSSGEVKIE